MNLIATVLKFGDRTQIGAVHLATSLVARPPAARRGGGVDLRGERWSAHGALTAEQTSAVVSLSGGALFANVVSVVLLVVETVSFQRRWRRSSWRSSSLPGARGPQVSSPGVFLVLRRMRVPLIVLIVIFAVSVLGLSLMPGEDAAGRPDRMGIFDAFYFVSYTATTIGFGELPHGVHRGAADVGHVDDLPGRHRVGVRDRLAALADAGPGLSARPWPRRTHNKAARRMREPFLLLVGYGNAAKMLGRSLDDMGRRFVVIDSEDHGSADRRATPTAPTLRRCSATPGTPG